MHAATRRYRPAARPGGRTERLLIAAPILVLATMYPVFRVTDATLGDGAGGRLGWFVGLAVYWIAWGGLFSAGVLGKHRLRQLTRPLRPTAADLGLVALFVLLAAGARYLVPGMAYEKATVGAWILLLVSPIGNGVAEEILWRGVYLDRFRDSVPLGIVWPSVGFGMWHLIPVGVGAGDFNAGMIIGPMLMGFYLSYLARRTNSVWWPIVAHTLGGYVMVT